MLMFLPLFHVTVNTLNQEVYGHETLSCRNAYTDFTTFLFLLKCLSCASFHVMCLGI
jgi:hypothetical protein